MLTLLVSLLLPPVSLNWQARLLTKAGQRGEGLRDPCVNGRALWRRTRVLAMAKLPVLCSKVSQAGLAPCPGLGHPGQQSWGNAASALLEDGFHFAAYSCWPQGISHLTRD